MEIKEDALSTVAVPKVYDKDNYVVWSVRVKTCLIAQDLWEVVEATTEPPKQEDDEAAFKAWSNKNSMAIHVLQASCRPDALAMIKKISSAKIAWNTLAVVLQVLQEDNYVDWSVRVKTYFIAHDLWEIIEPTTKPPTQYEYGYKDWSKKNSQARDLIRYSCGQTIFLEIWQINSAKNVWFTLAKKFLQVLKEDKYEEWSVRVKTYLMAHELWDIIEATIEAPKQEDDEAAFKAWSNKNSMALHVLQVSCGPHALPAIREISSAKIAWNTLAVVLQVLEEDYYVDWSVRVKTYLMAHDLWDIIEAATEPPKQEDDEDAFKVWSKKNSTALHVIQISCGPDTFSEIIQISSAKTAWFMLAKKFLQLLEEDKYEEWSVRVKPYLMAHELWDIIEATIEAPKQEDDEAAFKAWSNKNSMALHVLQVSCGPHALPAIREISSAKIAWNTLAGYSG